MTGGSDAGGPATELDPSPSAPRAVDARFADLDRALDAALRPWRQGGAPPVVLFSGGVDSGLLGWELRSVAGVRLFTVGARDSADRTAAREAAGLLGLPLRESDLDAAALGTLIRPVEDDLDRLAPVRRAIFASLAAAVALAPPGPLLCGQGADELFLGYAHFRSLEGAALQERAVADLEQLLRDDWPRTVRIARRLGREIHAPYLDPGFVRAALGVPIEARRPGAQPKALFRGWAMARGLPPPIAARPKKAIQYGTGVDRMLRRSGSGTESLGRRAFTRPESRPRRGAPDPATGSR